MAFALDPRLEADTIKVASLSICELLIMNDARYPWAILVPRIEGACELHDLSAMDGAVVWAEVMAVAKAIGAWPDVEKVNVGALGNIVSQLHVHVIGRHTGDPAWPGPVWGHSARVPYDKDGEEALARHLIEVCV
jgi:diadenosine tetraphosphate (Ap4A) HIT family hydrolase